MDHKIAVAVYDVLLACSSLLDQSRLMMPLNPPPRWGKRLLLFANKDCKEASWPCDAGLLGNLTLNTDFKHLLSRSRNPKSQDFHRALTATYKVTRVVT